MVKTVFKRHKALIAALVILWLTVSLLFILSAKRNQGHLIYVVDDAYIHMAIAKNFAGYGVWGISRYQFSSSSSSILWTLLLSGVYFLFGVNEMAPFLLNLLFSSLILFLVYFIVYTHCKLCKRYLFFLLLGIIFLTPLPALIFLGMEHNLQILIIITFVFLAASILSEKNYNHITLKSTFFLFLAPLIPLIRYEGLFLISILCFLFLMRKRYILSFFVGLSAAVPVTVYGFISKSFGWFWLPNSILLKGNTVNPASLKNVTNLLNYMGSGYINLLKAPHLIFLIVTAFILYIIRFNREDGVWEKGQVLITIYLMLSFLHLQFAAVGSFHRHDAYLVALGLIIEFVLSGEYILSKKLKKVPIKTKIEKDLMPKYGAMFTLALFLLVPFIRKGIFGLIQVPQKTTNIYEQQYQMGLFLKEFYQHQVVIANDIGAINYLADVRCLDLYGLGTLETAKIIRKNRYLRGCHFPLQKEIDDLTKLKGGKIAVIYDTWFQHKGKSEIPDHWKRVGQWRIVNNITCGSDLVSFYAVDSPEREKLAANLYQFSKRLPQSVIFTIN